VCLDGGLVDRRARDERAYDLINRQQRIACEKNLLLSGHRNEKFAGNNELPCHRKRLLRERLIRRRQSLLHLTSLDAREARYGLQHDCFEVARYPQGRLRTGST
jgi:hypothetical protein